MPVFRLDEAVAETFEEKVDMLKKFLFFSPTRSDLADIEHATYPAEAECQQTITEEEVFTAILRQSSDKATGPDGIPNKILIALADLFTKWLLLLLQACVNLAYHPTAFKVANAIALKKGGNRNYVSLDAYRPISLLNTTGKILESVMVKRIVHLAESLGLFPDSQMGARSRRSTESALDLLTEQVHTRWEQGKNKVFFLLNLDVASAFFTVSHERLLHDLRIKEIPRWIVKRPDNYISDKHSDHRRLRDGHRNPARLTLIPDSLLFLQRGAAGRLQ